MTSSHNKPSKPGFRMDPLYWLLVALPVALVLEWRHANGLWIFGAACVAIIPLAGLMGRATENLAEAMGPSVGGLLNATFGNAAELIIALFALHKGETELVKASITGSILGNILLVLGLSIVVGGCFHRRQTFNRSAASLGATMLALAAIGLIIPTIFFHLTKHRQDQETNDQLNFLSEEIAAILAILYVLSLVFNLVTHRHLFAGPETEKDIHAEPPEWSKLTAGIVLLAATGGVALMSELLVGSVTAAGEALGMNHVFVGVIVVAIIGNAAEHSTAVLVAMKDQMDLAVTIAIGSSIQVAMFVAPVLVFASMAMGGRPLDLHFSIMEAIALVMAVGVMSMVSQDGETHWMEGAMLLAVYAMLALAFYHLPPETGGGDESLACASGSDRADGGAHCHRNALQRCRRGAIGGHGVQHAAERTQQDVVFQAHLSHRATDVRQVAPRNVDLDDGDAAADAQLFNTRMFAHGLQCLGPECFQAARRVQRLRQQLPIVASRDRAGQRISGERMPVKKSARAIGRAECLNDRGGNQRGRQRQYAAGERLGGTQKIRHDAGGLVRPQRPSAAAAGHHLVGDEEDAMPLRDLDDLPQRFRRVHAHTAGALHERLQNDGGS